MGRGEVGRFGLRMVRCIVARNHTNSGKIWPLRVTEFSAQYRPSIRFGGASSEEAMVHGRIRIQQGVLNVRNSFLFATVVASMLIGSIATAQGQPGGSRPSGTNVAVIDVGFVFKNATGFKRAMDEIKADDENFKQDAIRQQEAMKADLQNLQKLPKGSVQYKSLEEKIAGDQTKLRLDMARQQKDRVESEAKIYFNAYQTLEREINKFATTYGIDLVLRYNGEAMDPSQPESVLNGINRFVVYQRDINITGPILDQMNRGVPGAQGAGQARRPQIPPR